MGRQLFRLALLAIVAFVGVRACQDWQAKRELAARSTTAPAAYAADSSSYASAKTRRMEAELQVINQRLEEIRGADMTDAERERAIRELLERQRRLIAEGEASPPAPN